MSAENGKAKAVSSLLLTNGAGLGAGVKLSSLTPARDLTLGGRGSVIAAKKVFLPNLNVVRNKNANVKTSKDTTARGRGRGRGAGDRGRGATRGARGGANSTLIQTSGVFSEGAGAVQIRKAAASSSYSRSADDAPSAMRKPTLIKSEFHRIDAKAEAAHVRELLGDSDDDDFGDEKTDLEQIPIKLNEAKWKYLKTEIKKEKLEINGVSIEDAALNDDDSAVAIAQKIQSLHVQAQEQELQRTSAALPRYPQSVAELLQTAQSQIFVMQLPDTLPCEDADDSPELSTKASTSADAAAAAAGAVPTPTKPTAASKTHLLKQMEEGQVGKLLRYKSGKIKLVLGECYFDLDMGMETGFLQDLMSINANREERSGNMINLGPIQAKLTATPDWEHLLKQQTGPEHA